MEAVLADLSLEEEEGSGEGDGWEVEQELVDDEECLDFCLVGCFLTATSVNFQSMKTVLANLWHPLGGSTSLKLGKNSFYSDFIVRKI